MSHSCLTSSSSLLNLPCLVMVSSSEKEKHIFCNTLKCDTPVNKKKREVNNKMILTNKALLFKTNRKSHDYIKLTSSSSCLNLLSLVMDSSAVKVNIIFFNYFNYSYIKMKRREHVYTYKIAYIHRQMHTYITYIHA